MDMITRARSILWSKGFRARSILGLRTLVSPSRPIDLLREVDTFVFDCDGVIWKGNTAIAGAKEALATLRSLNKNIFFVTNNSTRSRKGFKSKFDILGIQASVDEILTSSYAAAVYLDSIRFKERDRNKVYIVGDVGIAEELNLVGIQHLGGREDADKRVNFKETFRIDPAIGAVIVGLDTSLNYYKLQYAQLCLNTNPDCLFIATNEDALGHFTESQEWPGAGSIVGAVKGCTGKVPIVVGKPSSILIDQIVHKFGLPVDRMCMVGDRLDTDILFGKRHRMKTCLTLSGVTTSEKLVDVSNQIIPDIVIDSIRDLISQ